LRSALEDSIKPLHEYVKTFAQFEHENQLNPDKYVKGLDEGDDPVDAEALRTDILKHRKLEAQIKDRIPESVTVSIFTVNIKDIRNFYSGKY